MAYPFSFSSRIDGIAGFLALHGTGRCKGWTTGPLAVFASSPPRQPQSFFNSASSDLADATTSTFRFSCHFAVERGCAGSLFLILNSSCPARTGLAESCLRLTLISDLLQARLPPFASTCLLLKERKPRILRGGYSNYSQFLLSCSTSGNPQCGKWSLSGFCATQRWLPSVFRS